MRRQEVDPSTLLPNTINPELFKNESSDSLLKTDSQKLPKAAG